MLWWLPYNAFIIALIYDFEWTSAAALVRLRSVLYYLFGRKKWAQRKPSFLQSVPRDEDKHFGGNQRPKNTILFMSVWKYPTHIDGYVPTYVRKFHIYVYSKKDARRVVKFCIKKIMNEWMNINESSASFWL